MTKAIRNNLDLIVLALTVAAFVALAARRLESVPVPETDESYTLQVPYEMLNRGHLSLPMYRFLGGNIENVWHSYTPVYFVLLGGFLKITGWGLVQGRMFNLITAALLLAAVHALGRRMFDWRVGLAAVVLLISDQTFFERSRLLRNDFAAAAFAMLAYYLYEVAREKRRTGWYIASGVAAGAGVMCHTNVLYMFGGIGLIILIEDGWRALKERNLYLYALSGLAVMSYEIVYDLIDYKNFVLQNRDDRLHFGVLSWMGWWRNLTNEADRYIKWNAGGSMLPNVPRLTLHVFQLAAAVSIAYLVFGLIRSLRRRAAMQQPSARLLVVTFIVVAFHALITSHKDVYYMAHITPWFALCAAVGLRDLLDGLVRLWRKPRFHLAALGALTGLAVATVLFGAQLARQSRRYLREVASADLASFDQLQSALRHVVPDGVCPVAMKSPVMWLAFPEYDRCFASIEERMTRDVDIDGKEYAVLVPASHQQRRLMRIHKLEARYPLLGELSDTPYGKIRVYYTGNRSDLKNRPPRHYYFFLKRFGYATGEQVARAREVWSVEPNLRPDTSEQQPDDAWHWSIEVKPQSIYAISAEPVEPQETSEVPARISVIDSGSRSELCRLDLERGAKEPILGVFKTAGSSTIDVRLQMPKGETARPDVRRLVVREVD